MIGAVVLATDQGLGYLAKSFYDHGLIDRVLIHYHSSRINHEEWYLDAVSNEEDLLAGIKTLILFETPFDWKIIPRARAMGIKVVLMPMYECTRYPFPYQPDLLLCPSMLDLRFYKSKGENCKLVTVPHDIPFRLRHRARVFVHNAGNGGLGGRNGTRELLLAMEHVKSPIKLIVRSQVPIASPVKDSRIEYRIGQQENIWKEGDVFVFPEKFNGLSLPLQEACAAGMMVMCGERFPMTEWLPNEPMIPVKGYHEESISTFFQCAEYDPKKIAECIDYWYDKDITEFSLAGREFSKKNSWKRLKGKYETLLSA